MTGAGLMHTAMLVLAGVLTALVLLAPLARLLPLDFLSAARNDRSNHTRAARQIGGLGLAGALFVVLAPLWGLQGGAAGGLAAGAIIMFMTGLADDARELGPIAKLGGQASAIVLALAIAGAELPAAGGWPIWLVIPVTAIGMLYWVNAVNFMDGLDLLIVAGLTLPLAVLAALVIRADPGNPAAAASLVLAGALSAFAVFNRPPARMFLGDSGSLLAGFVSGGLIATALAVLPPVAAIAPFAYFLADSGSVIVLRLFRRENIFRAHSIHGYQIAKRSGMSALAVSAQVFGATVLLCLVSGIASLWPDPGSQAFFGFVAALIAAIFTLHLRRKAR